MDAAVSRMPLCPICENRVDENDPDNTYYIVDGEHYHAKCVAEEIMPCERCGVRGYPGWQDAPCLCCEGCEGRGDLSVHGLDGQPCGMCNGSGRAKEKAIVIGSKVHRIDEPYVVLRVREIDPEGLIDGTPKALCTNAYAHGKWMAIKDLEVV